MVLKSEKPKSKDYTIKKTQGWNVKVLYKTLIIIVDNKNLQQEKSQSLQQCYERWWSRFQPWKSWNLMVIMMIFIYKGIFLPTIVATLLRMFITTKQMLAAAMIIICQRWYRGKFIWNQWERREEWATNWWWTNQLWRLC